MQLSEFDRILPFLRPELERRGKVPPETLRELREGQAYREFLDNVGTHSVIDVADVGPGGDMIPLEDHEILVLFGTEKPTREDWENARGGHLGWTIDEVVLERWTGRCVVLFKDDEPDEVAFWGISGD
jgi:hypothetical protein